ncbi:MAG: NAD-dependent epimerase/dehydratase family protein [Candidatus Brocadia sp.]|nr:NAD-dependent epimerase/dehydratase family protein [Candidatus Brocadia sp.]
MNKQLRYRTILITGGAGFVGSNLAISFKRKYPNIRVIAFDNLKRRGSELNPGRLKQYGIEFVHGDIRNPEDLEFNTKIDLLFECSAEPSVMAGYGESPAYLINTNLVGTVNCLEFARKVKSDVIFLSTSRIYPYDVINRIKIAEKETRFEWSEEQETSFPGWSKNGIDVDFTLRGSKSMYGATKLCSEIILQEYIKMYGMKGVIIRCGVIAGPWQFGRVDQGVFTLWMLAHYFRKPLRYIGFGGRGKQVRDLLHVDDLFELLELLITSIDSINGEIYNLGGGRAVNLSLLETTELCEDITGNTIEILSEPKTRPADLSIYITDNQKISDAINWKPRRDARKILEDTYLWIKNNENVLRSLLI